jgi:hypothetical protein
MQCIDNGFEAPTRDRTLQRLRQPLDAYVGRLDCLPIQISDGLVARPGIHTALICPAREHSANCIQPRPSVFTQSAGRRGICDSAMISQSKPLSFKAVEVRTRSSRPRRRCVVAQRSRFALDQALWSRAAFAAALMRAASVLSYKFVELLSTIGLHRVP